MKLVSFQRLAQELGIVHEVQSHKQWGTGHINDTFLVSCRDGQQYIFQRVNEEIFKRAEDMMENIMRVTETMAVRLDQDGVADASRKCLRFFRGRDGRAFVRDEEGRLWRSYHFIGGASTFDIVQSAEQAFEAAKTFGEFQNLVSGITGERLHETIPNFHNTRARFDRLLDVVSGDPCGRLARVQPEWDFVRAHEGVVDVLLYLNRRGEIPERVTHNDTKLNNVLIDDVTGKGICVLDLDTVMPGLALYDFGDMVRSSTSPAAEDEPDVSKVRMQMPMFEALASGFLTSTSRVLNEAEKEHLAFSGKLISLEIGIRFLTDFLEGDVYFKTSRPHHNLERCRTQFALVKSIEAQEDAMRQVVAKVLAR